jgi:hypothetical protein
MTARARGFIEWRPRAETWEPLNRVRDVLDRYVEQLPLPLRQTFYRPRVQVLGYRPILKWTLLGFECIEGPNGLRISAIPLFAGENGAFVALLPKPVPVRHGTHARPAGGPQDGAIHEWRDCSLADKFAKAVVRCPRDAIVGADLIDRNGTLHGRLGELAEMLSCVGG